MSQVQCVSVEPGACVTGAVCIGGTRCLCDRYGVYLQSQLLVSLVQCVSEEPGACVTSMACISPSQVLV